MLPGTEILRSLTFSKPHNHFTFSGNYREPIDEDYFPRLNDCTVAVIGLGYVGLPLALEFAKSQVCRRTGAALKRRVIGFDINSQRLNELCQGIDRTNETTAEELKVAYMLEFTSDSSQLVDADVFVVTVPTPIDRAKRLDLTPSRRLVPCWVRL